LLPTDSDHAFGEFMVHIGWADAVQWQTRNNEFFAQYQAGTLVLADYIAFATAVWRHRPQAEADAAHRRFMQEVIGPQIRPAALELVRKHQTRGDLVALVTATNEFITTPIAAAFGIEHLLAVQLERDDNGQATGQIRGVPTFQAGKVVRVNAWLAERGQTLSSFDEVAFYSDSTNDLPLLELVSHPVATNPTPALAAIAQERGWRILNLFETP